MKLRKHTSFFNNLWRLLMLNVIKERKSVRTYQKKSLSEKDLKAVQKNRKKI